jgi:ArsR family transcriptional regulator, cadmium/lead-responsive transcriptional repressor
VNEHSLFRCLGDPTRLLVLKNLADGDERTVGQLVELTGQERTNVSHHLAQLRACDLVRTRNEGKHVLYSLGHTSLRDLLELSQRLVIHIKAEDPESCPVEGCC